MRNIIQKYPRGSTLLELTVAIAIFSIMALAIMQIFKMVIAGQRTAIAAQDTQESIRYAMEVMAKEIRTAKKNDNINPQCASISNNKVYDVSAQGDELYIKNYKNQCVTYRLNGERIEIERYPANNPSAIVTGFVTPDEIKVSGLKFFVIDNIGTEQSRATIRMNIEAVGKEAYKQNIVLQTTVSSRYYE